MPAVMRAHSSSEKMCGRTSQRHVGAGIVRQRMVTHPHLAECGLHPLLEGTYFRPGQCLEAKQKRRVLRPRAAGGIAQFMPSSRSGPALGKSRWQWRHVPGVFWWIVEVQGRFAPVPRSRPRSRQKAARVEDEGRVRVRAGQPAIASRPGNSDCFSPLPAGSIFAGTCK